MYNMFIFQNSKMIWLNSNCTFTEHWRSLPLSRRSTNGHIALSSIMISRVTLIKHLSAYPWPLIPQHLRLREGRGRATVNIWEPKQWHAAWNCICWKISRNSVRQVPFINPALLKLVKNSLKTVISVRFIILSSPIGLKDKFTIFQVCLKTVAGTFMNI